MPYRVTFKSYAITRRTSTHNAPSLPERGGLINYRTSHAAQHQRARQASEWRGGGGGDATAIEAAARRRVRWAATAAEGAEGSICGIAGRGEARRRASPRNATVAAAGFGGGGGGGGSNCDG